MLLLTRYIVKKLFLSLILISLGLLLIALSNKFASYLSKVGAGQLPLSFVLKLLALHIPELLALLLPLSLMLALLLTYGKLYVDSEAIVLFSSGLSPRFLVKVALSITSLLSLFIAILVLFINPRMSQWKDKALIEAEKGAFLQNLVPGQFQSSPDGKWVFYIESIDGKQTPPQMKDIFVSLSESQTKAVPNTTPVPSTVIFAETAKQVFQHQQTYLVLEQGHRYTGTPGTANYTEIAFAEYGRAIQTHPLIDDTPHAHKTWSSASLWRDKHPVSHAELGWRVSLVLSTFVLSLLALPLSKVNPREGRFAHFLPCMLLYIVYYNALVIAKRWSIEGLASPFLLFSTVHLIAGAYALYQLKRWVRQIG